MIITEIELSEILTRSGAAARLFTPLLNKAMVRYEIDTLKRVAAFIAQIGHESGELRYLRELGSNAYLSKYDTGELARRLGNSPDADGDGQRYCGRGLIQITGLSNYRECGNALKLDLVNHPQWLEQPEYACLSAAWYWHSRCLNALADKGAFEAITRRINGGLNGQAERLALYKLALSVLA
ncbi:glycoside hydrolase family 19 protein [Pseudomonas sp. ITA]|uniref:glycoside hydrolase family 19 protein n=1 Tax=Pseudomonas sp. ITA TaxID=2825841 RepID=UPI00249870E9|nr:glycoside hydrolase family 19 protein [Pseudomonas sp. ITA]MDI2145901.1 glycoside hydrolase family 19 protein [Pseudomonas sp. ITA]